MDRKADPETQLEVDEAILDYLIYTAITSLLQLLDTIDRSPRKQHNAHLLVQMVDTFLPVFRALHADYKASPEIQLRLRLFQFTYVFVQHYHPFAAANTAFARRPSTSTTTETPRDQANSHQEHHAQAMSLEQTLPLFLALSAVQNELQGSTITEIWMVLAAGYMAQSYIEQVVVYQNRSSSLLDQAFHWGYDEDCSAEQASEQRQINDMFGADESSVRLWESIREEHIQALYPPEDTSLVDHLENMASGALSVVTFKEKVSEFLAGLLSAYQPPLLIQLESGQVDGLSRKATKALKIRSGFLHQPMDET